MLKRDILLFILLFHSVGVGGSSVTLSTPNATINQTTTGGEATTTNTSTLPFNSTSRQTSSQPQSKDTAPGRATTLQADMTSPRNMTSPGFTRSFGPINGPPEDDCSGHVAGIITTSLLAVAFAVVAAVFALKWRQAVQHGGQTPPPPIEKPFSLSIGKSVNAGTTINTSGVNYEVLPNGSSKDGPVAYVNMANGGHEQPADGANYSSANEVVNDTNASDDDPIYISVKEQGDRQINFKDYADARRDFYANSGQRHESIGPEDVYENASEMSRGADLYGNTFDYSENEKTEYLQVF
ncbi:uncharacterized protein LOC106158354 [Lingula anatina]|uniref:Uncharacterized protein LOC106158354 n=1 Tax=Lingula anatina TaxID=7574 RepID=A0A1S3HUM1_LINAN|nr:uncharacterized protein LOC106158354 [Lingula anatina]|eukprot:XP_013389740.1 uncharacterized protein LOC106158354 [Lingula anatina]